MVLDQIKAIIDLIERPFFDCIDQKLCYAIGQSLFQILLILKLRRLCVRNCNFYIQSEWRKVHTIYH
jgi:hypothetical protein